MYTLRDLNLFQAEDFLINPLLPETNIPLNFEIYG